jgi:hypothetical protein
MGFSLADVYSKIKKSSVSNGGVYFQPGVYLVEIKKAFFKESRKAAVLLIVECSILESDCAERPAGSDVTWTCNMSLDSGPGNCKAFIAATAGIPSDDTKRIDDEVTDEVMDSLFGEDNMLGGMRMKVQATDVDTKAGGKFTKLFWELEA